MRVIKFRGKRVDNGEWLHGDLLQPNYERFLKNKDIGNFLDEYKISILEKDFIRNDYVVDPETIGQYTGHKDKNGKEIYEGDIMQTKEGTFQVVVYHNELLKNKISYASDFGCKDDDGYWAIDVTDGIIGNIHDNPELFKKESK